MTENPYAAPRTPVTDADVTRPERPGVGARFLWTLASAFPIFMATVLGFVPRERWLLGAIGSAIFASFCGLIAMCIPVRWKAAFIIPSIVIGLFCAYLIGTHAR